MITDIIFDADKVDDFAKGVITGIVLGITGGWMQFIKWERVPGKNELVMTYHPDNVEQTRVVEKKIRRAYKDVILRTPDD